MKEVTVIKVNSESGDWSGLFVNGKLEYEGHDVYERDWIDLINKYKYFKDVCSYWVNDEYLENCGSLPNKISDIPSEYLNK